MVHSTLKPITLASAVDAIVQERAFSWRAHLPQLRDPGKASLRRALRAALLVPALFAACSAWLPMPQLITFATFGTFALSVMGDFGGSSGRRAAAYALSTAIGCLLIGIGTLASTTPLAAALVVFVGGFALQFAGVFGGYATAAQLPLLLSLVLAVAIPAPPEALPQRLAGWVVGGTVALVGGVWLWPRHEQTQLLGVAADACDALAEVVLAKYVTHAAAEEVDRQRQRARTALDALRQAYLVTPWRPASPARQDRAYAELVDGISRALKVVSVFDETVHVQSVAAPAGEAFGPAVVEVLRASGRVLRGDQTTPDLDALVRQRELHREAVDGWAAAELRSGTPAGAVLDGIEATRSVRIVAYTVLTIGASATLAAGRGVEARAAAFPREVEVASGFKAAFRRALGSLGTHLQPGSIWLRNSLRAALGLGAAVLLVELIGLDHAFWAVLGTLSVLRSNALATGRTALAAVVGTTLGILPVGLLLIPLGTNPAVLWPMFPIAVFLAAYAPSVIGFVVGQAAFTLLVVVLFNLIQPVGWTLGLVRLEDVVVGAGLSLVVGALLWPRGARGQLRTALGAVYRQDAAYVRTAFRLVLGQVSPEACEAARGVAVREEARAGEVFDQFLHDRAAKVLPPATWAALQAGGSHLLLAGDSLERMASHGTRVTACPAPASVVARAADAVLDEATRLGDSLERGEVPGSGPGAEFSDDELRHASIECLDVWGGADDASRRESALGLVTTTDWIRYLRMLADHLSGPAGAVVRIANLPWWH